MSGGTGSRPAGGRPAEQRPDGESYPGERFGFPPSGPGAIAGVGRRAGQLLVDIVLSWLAADALFPRYVEGVRTPEPWGSVLVYVVECVLLLLLGGQTAGMRLLGLRVVRLDGRPAGPVAALARTLLTLLVIPMLFIDRDVRGLHDRAAGVAVVRTRA